VTPSPSTAMLLGIEVGLPDALRVELKYSLCLYSGQRRYHNISRASNVISRYNPVPVTRIKKQN